MTGVEMYQRFQVYMDNIDSQDQPEIYPEQVFIFLNSAVLEFVEAIRASLESDTKLSDDGISLVKRVYIKGVTQEDRVVFNYNTATLTRDSPQFLPLYYFLNGRIESSAKIGKQTTTGISDLNYSQQDDIVPALSDPFNRPTYADKILCVRENSAIIATPPPTLTLSTLVGTAILQPAIISKTVNCDLREQKHDMIVKRATQIALENIESIRQKTYQP